MSGEHIIDLGRRHILNIYKRTGQYHRVLYAHTTVEIGFITINLSRWHDTETNRRDYHAEFGYDNGNEEHILNPNAQFMFHTGG